VSETMHTLSGEGHTTWIPVAAAAKVLKVSRQRVYQLLALGLISGRKVERTWLVSARSVAARLSLLREEGG
jgi:hypothetical protein